LVIKLKQEIIQLQNTNKEKLVLIDDLSFKLPDLEYLTSQKILDEETFHESRYCSQDSEDFILKLMQDIIELQNVKKVNIFSLMTCHSKFLI
jgi:hypothetical protein